MKKEKKTLITKVLPCFIAISVIALPQKTVYAASPKKITITAGNQKILKIHSSHKVRWKTSDQKVAVIRSSSKTKAIIKGKKAGKAKITAQSKKKKWTFNIKVKRKFRLKITQVPKLIRYYAPGIAANNVDVIGSLDKENDQTPSFIHFPGQKNNITASSRRDAADLNMIRMTVSNRSKVTCVSSNKKILSVQKTTPWKYISDRNAYHIRIFTGQKTMAYALIPHKKGTATITVKYPSGSYKRKIRVEPSAVYLKVKNQINEISHSRLDAPHKALLLAGYESQLMKYTGDGKRQWHTLYEDIIDGEGVCDDYARCFDYFCTLANIRSRFIPSCKEGDHAFNQINFNNRWYNVDVTWMDTDQDSSYLNLKGNFMCSSALFSHSTSANGQAKIIDSHIPMYNTYLTHATDYDQYDWDSFITANDIARKLGLSTLSIQQEQRDQIWIDEFKKAGYTDDDIAQIKQYRDNHPDVHLTVYKHGDQLYFVTSN